ncbi:MULTISPECIES: ArsR/SmtB family transcription factor [Prauserella salsuginis group]|uniref:DNA-binding transcriptional ArsR family regulator n=2 Tax=Prauserella salsuginis group TaxID=2893672 RepID=A0A839XU66_9PSEU|nr:MULTISPECIES: winged helix-turn-helix domain-containing protein [Prauserella salsuginis group]MBB3663556.1 DNA-binding transcriptional ArsR family regulator [Prauserella sediminis]MCR3720625.1 DNA-binding transcriptional regulator, ArsR family [Prauserella flava]MCR3735294.1 DNA-binding transcriptional regulator, ArsR family [Prauserella salsuginis]
MTLRIVFTRDDLQCVRVADRPDLMWELVQSLHQIQDPAPDTRYSAWHRETRHRIHGHDGAGALLGPLCTLVPAQGTFPDFLTPTADIPDIETGCERIVCTGRTLLERDLRSVFASRPAPSWIRDLAAGDRGMLTEVAAALHGAYDLLVRPRWSAVQDDVRADRARRMRTLSSAGVGGLLSGIPGVLGWDGEVLRVRYALDRTLHLGGRGITLVPSHFCWPNPISLIDPELPPTLVYPATPADPERGDDDVRHLEALLGPNRAACLLVLRKPYTTSALADRVGISAGSASKQATCLRESGLVVSERQGNAVVHRVSELGKALLAGRIPAYA